MSDVRLKYSGLSGSGDTSGQQYTSIYLVTLDVGQNGSIAAETSGGVPEYNSHYHVGTEYDLRAVLKSRTSKGIGKTVDGRNVFEVTCVFAIPSGDPTKEDPTRDPCDDPLEIEGDGEEYLEYPFVDLDGDEFKNTAGEPYSAETRATPKNYVIITIKKNQRNDPLPICLAYQNTVNSHHFYGWEPGTVKLAKMKWSGKWFNGEFHWEVVYVFHLKQPPKAIPGQTAAQATLETWYKEVLDAGEYYWAKESGVPFVGEEGYKRLNLVDGQPASGPVMLDGQGGLKPGGVTHYYLAFKVLAPANYGALNL